MSILLTLSVRSLGKLLNAKGPKGISLLEVPGFVINELRLHGLNLQASLLAGWSLPAMDRLRDRADKVGCPCLVLVEDRPLALGGSENGEMLDQVADRMRKLGMAASRLGCNAVAVSVAAPDTEEAFDDAALAIKSLMPAMDKLQLNLLLCPEEGLTRKPERLTELIKRVGGFRIGSLADFGHAADTGDMVQVLRRLAPYAGAIHATVRGFTRTGSHKDYDLSDAVAAIRSVGFVNTLAIDYTGATDPVANIEKAREILLKAVAAEEQ